YSGSGSYTLYATTSYAYDALDQLTSVADAALNTTDITYDSLGRKLTMDDPDLGVWSYLYDANGNLTRQTDANDQRICLFYDALPRLTGKHDNGTSNTCPANPTTITYSYDAGTNGKGHRTSMTSVDESTAWSYDARGRKIGATHMLGGGDAQL